MTFLQERLNEDARGDLAASPADVSPDKES
jgi:hypothetical protein